MLRHVIEICYASLALLTLTVGPVQAIWRDAQQYVPVNASHLATFVLMQMPAIALLSARSRLLDRNVSLLILIALISWNVFTASVSPHSAFAIVNALNTLLATSTGLYLAVSFSTRSRLIVTFLAMQLGVGISIIAVLGSWSDSRLGNGQWNGILINPNLLGPAAIIASLAGSWLLFLLWDELEGPSRLLASTVLSFFLFVNSIVVLNTSPVNALFAVAVSLAVVGTALMLRRRDERMRKTSSVGYLPQLALLVASFIALSVYLFHGLISGRLLPTSVLQSRIDVWSFSWHGALERPLFGWGQGVAWIDQDFRRLDGFWTVKLLAHSHSAFFETLLSSGFAGLILLVSYLAVGSIQRAKGVLPFRELVITFFFISFCICISIFEPFLATGLFTWTLLVMSLSTCVRSFSDSASSTVIRT